MINYQLNNQKKTSASQAEGHEFEPRLPLLKRHCLITMQLANNQECLFLYSYRKDLLFCDNSNSLFKLK